MSFDFHRLQLLPRPVGAAAFSTFMQKRLIQGLALLILAATAWGGNANVIDATFNSASDVPVTSNGFTATGTILNLTLNFAPTTGAQLTVVNNTGLPFIEGTFSNLAQGHEVVLGFGGMSYRFVANYYGGTGNDLVLHWAGTQVWGWGWNTYGQLGNNSVVDSHVPVAAATSGVLAGKTVIAISAGALHTLALCSDGTVVTWGENLSGKPGYNGTKVSTMPVAVITKGTVLEGKTVIAITAGSGHDLALCSDGTVAAWGRNMHGQLGNGITVDSPVPVAVTTKGTALAGKTVVALAALGHSLALCSDGTLAAWGENQFGQLGNSSTQESHVPIAVDMSGSAMNGKTFTAISAGSAHSLALCSDGTVAAWGWNSFGQLGVRDTYNRSVPSAVTFNGTALESKTVIGVQAGVVHSHALCSDGTVAAWGYNYSGQLGSITKDLNIPTPVAVTVPNTPLAGRSVVSIGTGCYHSLALCADGTQAAWGDNAYGELGNNSTKDSPLPVAVVTSPFPIGARVVALSSGLGLFHTVCLVAQSQMMSVTLPKTAPVLNKYTGLYEWLVQVKNTNTAAISGFDMMIADLPSTVSVRNGVPVYGESLVAPSPLLGYNVHRGVPLGAGQSVTLVLEFLCQTRSMPNLAPTITTSFVPSDDPPGKGQYGIPVQKVCKIPKRGNLVQFRSVSGSSYRVWYSVPAAKAASLPNVTKVKDSNLGWLPCPVPVSCKCSMTLWMDEGPPKTVFSPLEDATRQYRVELLPALPALTR